MDDERTTVELHAPLPGGDQRAVLTWRAPRGGLRPGDQEVPRAQAAHAALRTTDLDGRDHERRLDLAEADAYLAEARALHERAAGIDAAARERREAAAQAREEVVATIDLSCGRCGVPRTYRGARDVLTVLQREELGRAGDLGRSRPQAVAYHEYACPRCGSVELFADGVLPHPLRPAG